MSGAGTPPETGTLASEDDRYNGGMTFGAPPELEQTNSMMPGGQNDIFKGMPGAKQSPGLFSPQPMQDQAAPMQTGEAGNGMLAQALNLAMSQEGRDENVNRADIQQYLKTGGVGMDPSKAAWCAAFINSSIAQAGGKGTGSSVATSFLNYGEKADVPQEGDVLVQPRGRAAGQTGGHVGFATGNVREGPSGTEYEMFSGNRRNRATTSWEPASSVQIRRVGGQAAAEAAATVPTAPSTPQFGDPNYNRQPIAPELHFGDPGYELEPEAPAFGKVRIPYKGKIGPLADMQNPIAQELDTLANVSSPTGPAADQIEDFDTYRVDAPPKNAIPSQMFDPEVTFERAPGLFTPVPKQEPNFSKAQAFPLFESNYDLSNPPPAYETPVADIPFEERTFLQKLDFATRGYRQAGRGAMNVGTGLVYSVPEGLAALQALPSRVFGYEDRFHDAGYDFWKGRAEAARRGNQDLTGLSGQGAAPQTQAEKLLLTTGESVFPAGKYTAALTALLTGMKVAVEPAEAAPKAKPGSVAETFAGMISTGNVDLRNPTAQMNVIYVPQEDGTVIVAPQASIYGKPINLPPNKALDQYNRAGVFLGHFQTQSDAENFVESINSRVKIPVNTVGGPTKVSTTEYALMGALGATTIGLAFAPQVYQALRTTAPRLGRTVTDAAPGTEAFSTRGDLAAAMVYDINAIPLRVGGATIKNPGALERVQDLFTLQTRGAASNIADNAVRNGVSQGPNFTFKVKVPLAEQQAKATPEMEHYLNLLDTFDDLQAIGRARANMSQAKQAALPGPPVVRGYTDTPNLSNHPNVLTEIGNLERAHPELRQIGKDYRENLKALRDFESKGEWGTITTAERKRLNSENPNEVPFVGSERVWDDPLVQRQSPFIALGQDMRTRMRLRMENEAKGVFIDAMRKDNPSSFVRISQEQYNNNANWRPNSIEIYRKGKKEIYTTDPAMAMSLRMDPFYYQNKALNVIYKSKRIAEQTTTGIFAPFFAETSFLRNHSIAKPTAPTLPGMSAPNILQSVAAIPQQLGPQLAKYGAGPNVVKTIYAGIDRLSGGWVSQQLGPQFLDSLSKRLMTIHDDSLFARLEAAGSHRGSILESQIRSPNAAHWSRLTQTNNKVLDRVINGTKGSARTFFEGFKNTFGSMHNAPGYAFARRNEGKVPLPRLAGMARDLTGNSMSGGQLTNAGKMIRFQDDGLFGAAKTKAVQYGLGVPAEFGRLAVPWFNPSVQGMRRLGQAYIDDPKKFMLNAWLYTQLPAATAYSWNRALGVDPHGVSYSDYHINGRSPYNTMMNYYLAVPGRPASEGIQISRFHELAPMARWMEIAMDHAFRSNKHTAAEDFMDVATNAVKVIFSPSTPPLINAGYALAGMTGSQGLFEGDSVYRRRDQPFDQNAGLPMNIELYMRAIAPGLADVFGSGLSAAIQADEGTSRVGAFFKEAGERYISKAPISRAITNIQPPASGNTRATEELFSKQKAISELSKFYDAWGVTGGNKMLGKSQASIAGGKIATEALGQPLPRGAPGMGQPAPTNPLYIMFAKELRDTFKRDDPKNGGIGFNSMWKRYSNATTAIQSLSKVSAGNFVTWQRYLDSVPETKGFLQDQGVDWKNPKAVKSFYENYRQAAAAELLSTIKRVEQEFSKRLGQPIKFEQLKPFGKGLPKEDDLDLGFGTTDQFDSN